MKTEMRIHVLGATCFDFDGNRGGTLFVGEPADSGDQNSAGLVVTKVSCPFEMVAQLKAIKLPETLNLSCSTAKGAGMITKLVAESFKRPTDSK